MGGGTPSLLDEAIWQELVEFLYKQLSLGPGVEWTVECNPETITPELLARFQKSGVNRLSLGIQSFKEKFLKRLERGASAKRNRESLELISTSWPLRWSFDLMFGLPEQSLSEWEEDLCEAITFKPSHISAYQLTLTTEKSKKWLQPLEKDLLEAYRKTREILLADGLFPYEISNFSKAGEESRHNLKYWRAEAFLGLGPGAYALIPNKLLELSLTENSYGAHLKNPSNFEEWIKRTRNPLQSEIEIRTEKIHITELLLVGLRLEAGIEKKLFPQIDFKKLEMLSDFIEITPTHLRATDRGREILDSTILKAVSALF